MRLTREAIREHLEENSLPKSGDTPTGRRIVAAATRLFTERGYRQTTLTHVAKAAGIARATLYLHVKNKADLFLMSVFAEKLALSDAFLPAFDEGLSGEQRLRHCLRATVLVGQTSPLLTKLAQPGSDFDLAMVDLSPERRAEMAAMQHEGGDSFIELCAPGVFSDEERRKRATALRMIARASTLFQDPLIRDGLSLEEAADVISDVLIKGLLSP